MAASRGVMRCCPVLLLALVAGLVSVTHGSAAAIDAEAASHATPVSKVIQLLEEMIAKGTKEKADEATRFSAFSQWCTDQKRIKTDEIEAGNDKIDMLSAKIEKAAALIKSLTDRIQELDADVGRWKKDTKSTADVRAMEAADYKATSADYSESLTALDNAIMVLKKKATKTAQAEALLQVHSLHLVPASSKRMLTSFLQTVQSDEEDAPDKRLFNEAPEAYGYEFQSGGVVEMLEKLKDEFETKKYELDKEEMTAQHAFEDIAQQLKDNIENAEHEINKKTNLRADTQKNKASLEGEKAQAEADRAEDQKYLDETTGLCAQKSQDFDSRQKLRAQELDALGEAIEIMQGDDVSGSAKKHLPSLMAVGDGRGAALAQLRSGAENHLQARVSAMLAEHAKRYNSRVLALASQQVAANPFVKVKKMIKDLISTLMQEATEETEHKGWCDTELTVNKQTRDQKTSAIEELTASKEDLTSLISRLTQDIEDLTAAVKELDVAMAEATADRTESKEKNEQTIADAKAAQKAVQQATAVLKDFYAKSGEATALAQTAQSPADDAPETFDKPYTGLMPEGGGVLSFMEVILSDFARLESDTSSSEAAEQDEYENFIFESKKDKALKENEMGHKSAKKSDSEDSLAKTEQELKLTQQQLDKAIEYYEKLKPTCVDTGISYEERVKRREEEMQSLQEALKIMQGTDLS
jgi:chromosome segregation ATPase